jgi:GNAT superfamily N-acetyltransferase
MGEQIVERWLRSEDISAAFELSAQAGWNQTEDDWHLLLELAPESCRTIEIDGKLAATTTLLCYGRRLGWLGMVLTGQEYRRRGLARRLLTKTLEQADHMGVQTVKLDATEQGRPLYEQFGFRYEQEIERWIRAGDDAQLLPSHPHPEKAWHDSDSLVFGTDRTQLLEKLAQRSSPISRSRSYLFARKGRVTAYLGPCVSEDSTTARFLVQQATQDTHCGWSWDLLPQNLDAVAAAGDLGFRRQRRLVRMARGKDLRGKDDTIYAIAGFELG